MTEKPEDQPKVFETDVRAASLAQIHAAIERIQQSDFVSAIALGSAAEGILPETDKPYLFTKLQEWRKLLPSDVGGAADLNDFNNWVKHGKNDKRPEKAVISELEVMISIQRAISKFAAIYNEQSPQMKAFSEWAIKRLQSADKSNKPQKLKPRLPRGLADRGPSGIAATREMIEKIRAIYELYGFEPVETPAIEYTDALGKFLPDQDRPNEGVFSFQDDDEQWLSLRYDLTAPLARYVAENFDTLPKPYRSYRFGWVFRNEKPGPGRFRQFMQFDADTVGSASTAADAEMCMMAADALEALGIPRGSYIVKVNNRKVLDGVLESIGLEGEENAAKRLTVFRAIDKHDRLGDEGVRQLLGAGRKDESGDFTKGAGLSSDQMQWVMLYVNSMNDTLNLADVTKLSEERRSELDQPHLGEVLPEKDGKILYRSNLSTLESLNANFRVNSQSQQGIAELYDIFNACRAVKFGYDRIRIDPSVVRGLEYYTGPVFEVELTFSTDSAAGSPRFGSVGGGGRYDGLVSRFRGEPVPATGFSIGVSRLLAALQHLGKVETKAEAGPVVVTVFDKDRIADYQQMVAALRNAGIRAELYLGSGKFGPQMKYADKRNSPCVVIQGSDEKAKGEVTIKDLIVGAELAKLEKGREEHLQKQAEAQRAVPEAQLVEAVRAVLARHKLGPR
jgi:histidyl-tRNA synthetase